MTLLHHTIFQDVIYPPNVDHLINRGEELKLRRLKRFLPNPDRLLKNLPLVVFDLETTGLDFEADRIIEIGAHKIVNGNLIASFESLVRTDVERTEQNIQLTGISAAMLEGQPLIEEILPLFLEFIEGSILVAHNAEFDIGMIRAACSRISIDLDWPCFCTLKMAQKLLLDMERRNLDTLAERYGLTFEARHRAVGDIKVLTGVLNAMFEKEASHFKTWGSLKDFYVTPLKI